MEAAKRFGCNFVETSARTRENVEKAFYDTVREIRRYNRDMQQYPSGAGHSGDRGPGHKLEMQEEDHEAGCCGKCSVM
ncbi:hypothetical protein MRB53_038915 [Persea americana]|nr:hypothetical protein MRB53_038915 [Persea americana]